MKPLILLLYSAVVWAQCHTIEPGRHYCPTTGDPVADGRDLRDWLAIPKYACGDMILLDCGATYNTKQVPPIVYPFILGPQIGCGPTQMTTIRSTCADEFPAGYIPQMSDLPRMAVLKGARGFSSTSCGTVLCFYDDLNSGRPFGNYRLDGIAFTTDPDISAIDRIFFGGGIVNFSNPNEPTKLSEQPHDIELVHGLVTNGENQRYGPLADCKSIACAYRSTASGIVVGGTDITIKDTGVYGLGGFEPNGTQPTLTVTNATNQSPTRITATGLAAALRLTPPTGTECNNPTDGQPSCMRSCIGAGHCNFAVAEGMPAGFEALNGVVAVTYVGPNTVSVDKADSMCEWTPTHIDMTAAGAWSGTASIKLGGATITPVYNVVSSGVDSFKMINNHFENGDMTYFGAGGSFATSTGVVQPGSTADTIIMGNATGLAKVGDLVSVPAPGVSFYCGPPGGNPTDDACYGGGVRVGKITAISGAAPNLTFSVVPEGPDGIDVAPIVGKIGQWEGQNAIRIAWIRNKFFRDYNAFPVGKTAFEIKSGVTSRADGNLFYGTPNGTSPFLEVKNQGRGGTPDGANVPWSTGRDLFFSNNVIGSSHGGGVRHAINCGDYEHTTVFGSNVWFENNVMPHATTSSSATNFWEDHMCRNSGYRHNTLTANPASSNTWSITPAFTCTATPPLSDQYYFHFGLIRDNVVSYGEGIGSNPSCWPNQSTAVKGNVLIADGSVGVPAISAAWPGNNPVANLSAVGMVGPCDFAHWQNCGLSATSPYRGAATDGKDPGADILQVNDHQHGWSEAAGLIYYENLTATYNNVPGAFILGSTTATIRFRRFAPLDQCSLQLFTDPARRFLHPDTDAIAQACARLDNTDNGDVVSFSLGNKVPLPQGTRLYYQITAGERVMVGEFSTLSSQ